MNDQIYSYGTVGNVSLPAWALAVSMKPLFFLLTLAGSSSLCAQIQFQDVTMGSGITHVGESYGAAWGDLNADGWPDLYVSNHRAQRSLYVNNDNGTFTDMVRDVPRWRAYPTADTHGAAWGDFNNDGYQDLFSSVGARDTQELFVNEAGTLVDSMDPKFNHQYDNLNYRGWEARLPIWMDYSNDGLMDLLMMLRGIPQIFQQGVAGFTPMNIQTGVKCSNSQFGQLADLAGSRRLELICDDHNLWPSKIYDTTTMPLTNVSSIMPRTVAVNDSTLADFDGDLRTDLFLLIGAERLSEAALVNATRIEAQTIVNGIKEKGFGVQTDGVITIELHWTQRNLSRLFIGSTGWHPSGIAATELIKFSLDPADPTVWGIKARDPASDNGIFIGYDPSTMRWTIAVSPGGASTTTALQQTYWFIDTTTSFSVLTQNIPGADLPIRPVLRMNTGTGFPDEARARGVGDLMSCVSAVAGDFDNDMDEDIYAVCRGGVSNIENRLYENQGAGTFVRVPLAGGAAGFTGIGVGVGENVVVADYDVDGFQDLFVTNGLNMLPESPYVSRGGPDNLFHNVGNTNKWVELDLVGTTSNRDGVGAKIYATAGGVTQLHEQNGGYHRWAQNHQRIHFGLAANTLVDLRIEWPSGVVDTYANVPANHLYKVTEGSGYQELLMVSNSSLPSPCNTPTYSTGTEAAVFVWKNCTTGIWSMRATAGGGSKTYSGRVISSQPFSTLKAFSVEGNDMLKYFDFNNTEIDYGLTTSLTYQDGFDFSFSSNAAVCFKVDAPAGAAVYVGGARTQVTAAFDMATLGACPLPNEGP